MKREDGWNLKQIGIGMGALALLVLVIIVMYKASATVHVTCESRELDTGWNVEAHGIQYEDVTLSETLFEMFNRGDVMVLNRMLPGGETVPNPVLQCYSVHAMVEVFIEGREIFSYGKDLIETGRLLGYGMNYIPLPADYAGKELTVRLTVAEDDAFEGEPAMAIVDGSTFVRRELAEQKINFAVTLFLIVFGLIGMGLSLTMLFKQNAFFRTYCISATSFLLGCWTACNVGVMQYFVRDLSVKSYLEYYSFYLVIIPFILYFKDRVMNENTPKGFRIAYGLLVGADVLLACLAFALQTLNIVHLPAFLRVFHLMIALNFLFLIVLTVWEYRQKHYVEKWLTIGFGLVILTAAAELVRYNLSKYIVGFSGNMYTSVMDVGALILVMTLLVDFGSKVAKSYYRDAWQKLLERMAYVDELTGLFNRRKCDEVMEKLDESDMKYAIVSLDMNLLKIINDTYGHESGDMALKQFSKILQECFPQPATVGRMGGDEFIVILPDVNAQKPAETVQEMERRLDAVHIEGMRESLSAAYGVAYRGEGGNAFGTYRLADERMYRCKRDMKSRMNG